MAFTAMAVAQLLLFAVLAAAHVDPPIPQLIDTVVQKVPFSFLSQTVPK